MEIKKEKLSLNESLYKKLYHLCEFSNLKLKFISGVIFRIENTNVNYLESHRFIISYKSTRLLELLCYDNLHLYLFDRSILIAIARVKIDIAKQLSQ